ncbi:NAD(P)-dependent dehydrogenase (short-subunit alcohol dehydrogenase family) [Paenibacillus shirakamiensis]|uniref:NAD(P)-dependent dehydrogenase (Short-subunit alcohol dehydrogenase family) n=1 Tax=Paenibacillus shirakamiensis TaxID=1265935 RepID=A0ABS4JIN3_9BACL|nr:SDR family oxidoreductase [Paenibacillus shirakamiensis]MBP2000459.1 NAD(P)-dependent dehydrogenase (short-subunit alcohol dehydrogenase family) [Paenibacillus shirakamiensis]
MSKVAVVTGAASGIGLAVSIRLIEKGFRVYALDCNAEALQRNTENSNEFQYVPMSCDVCKLEEVQLCFQRIAIHERHIDVLFNGVGWMKFGGLLDVEISEWNKAFSSNIMTAVHCIKEAVPLLKKSQNSPSIINLSSILGDIHEHRAMLYCLTKSMLTELTRCLAKELAPDRIRVNAILPGSVQTQFINTLVTDAKSVKGGPQMLMELSHVPLGRLGTTEDIASLVIYLASEQAEFLTGTCIPVDGGWSL